MLAVIHKHRNVLAGDGDSLLRFALSSEPIAAVVLDGLGRDISLRRSDLTLCAVPQDWGIQPRTTQMAKVVSYAERIPLCSEFLWRAKRDSWFVVSNGRFAAQINNELLARILAEVPADVVAVNAESELLAAREKVRLTAQGKVAGFRRLYDDSAQLSFFPSDWPHYLFIKPGILERVAEDQALPESFSAVVDKCRSAGLVLQSANVAGTALDLETEAGLLSLCAAGVNRLPLGSRTLIEHRASSIEHRESSDGAGRPPRLAGRVLLGTDVLLAPDVVIVGPTIIGDNTIIERGAVIESAIIGPQVRVPPNQLVRDCIVKGSQFRMKGQAESECGAPKRIPDYKMLLEPQGFAVRQRRVFRTWRAFSYARCLKRILDVLAAVIVLVLFAPVTPFIALAIKLTSPGPVFYKDKRQGLHAKTFNCLKFRTMRTGSDRIQEKLRVVSQVDGPQFKIKNDPRISTVGRFLRDTYIDEIPQFFNVLLGQMSVVGPRPSPEAENTLCPSWRDARLSVRPGITGLWQVCRTRKPEQDFQEWIHYDTEYVRKLSPGMDLWICRRTIKKMVESFISQF
jgi:lipopolysaccharide/colanic/teichoic acid biosynthesis glycosyltransferase/carbonic anhydrase/acetyltransferase-like protein (isoleucine patch superfamily)